MKESGKVSPGENISLLAQASCWGLLTTPSPSCFLEACDLDAIASVTIISGPILEQVLPRADQWLLLGGSGWEEAIALALCAEESVIAVRYFPQMVIRLKSGLQLA